MPADTKDLIHQIKLIKNEVPGYLDISLYKKIGYCTRITCLELNAMKISNVYRMNMTFEIKKLLTNPTAYYLSGVDKSWCVGMGDNAFRRVLYRYDA